MTMSSVDLEIQNFGRKEKNNLAENESTESKTILETVKEFLGDVYDTSFDAELLGHIGGYLANLNQVGVGKQLSMLTKDKDATWEQFFDGQDGNKDFAVLYVNYKTKIAFDPPQPVTLAAMTEAAKEALWRAELSFDKS